MPLKFMLVAGHDAEQQQMETLLQDTGRATLAGKALALPVPFPANEALLRQILAQTPEAVLLALPAESAGIEAALRLVEWIRQQMPLAVIMVVGPMEPSQLIVRAMRAGANEYLEQPLRAAALDEAVGRCAAARSRGLDAGETRGKLIAVLGARGGCGSTTVAVNIALALHSQRRDSDPPALLLDAAPLGHTSLHLNLKPQFTLLDLLSHTERLDASLLSSLTMRHRSGLELLAGPPHPLPDLPAEKHTRWLEMLLHSHPVVVADLSARLDGLTRAVIERADRILFVTQTDMVSLWSAAKVRQYLDAPGRLRFEMVLNRYTATPEVDLPGLENLTHTPVLWKLPNAHALVTEAIEKGEPAVERPSSELAKSFLDLAAILLGRPEKKRGRGWLPFFKMREAEG